MVLTVHVSFMFIFNECIAARFPCSLAVDDVNLEQNDHMIVVFVHQAGMQVLNMSKQ